MKRKKYSAEFKAGAIDQVRRADVSCAHVARELGTPVYCSVLGFDGSD